MTICKVDGCETPVAKHYRDGERIEYDFCRAHKCICKCGNVKAKKPDGSYKARCQKCLKYQSQIEKDRYYFKTREQTCTPDVDSCHES